MKETVSSVCRLIQFDNMYIAYHAGNKVFFRLLYSFFQSKTTPFIVFKKTGERLHRITQLLLLKTSLSDLSLNLLKVLVSICIILQLRSVTRPAQIVYFNVCTLLLILLFKSPFLCRQLVLTLIGKLGLNLRIFQRLKKQFQNDLFCF